MSELNFSITDTTGNITIEDSNLYKLKPTFRIVNNLAFTNESFKNKVLESITVKKGNITVNNVLKSWYNDSKSVKITFSENLMTNETYTIQMFDVIDGINNTCDSKTFKTMGTLTLVIENNDDNYFSQNPQYFIPEPTFTIRATYNKNGNIINYAFTDEQWEEIENSLIVIGPNVYNFNFETGSYDDSGSSANETKHFIKNRESYNSPATSLTLELADYSEEMYMEESPFHKQSLEGNGNYTVSLANACVDGFDIIPPENDIEFTVVSYTGAGSGGGAIGFPEGPDFDPPIPGLEDGDDNP